jgi:hypothetical protein
MVMATATARIRLALLACALAPLWLGGKCGGGDGSSGSPPVLDQSTSDPRCAPLVDIGGFPPGYDFIPAAAGNSAPLRLLAATATRSSLIPLAIEEIPFAIPQGTSSYLLPADSDGDGNREFFKSIDDVVVVSPSLALATVSGNIDAVLFVDPSIVGPREVWVAIPADFDPADFAPFPGLPAPGTSRLQTGITTTACVDAGPGAVDSRGVLLADGVDPRFWCNGPGTFPASFSSGAAVVADRLFASTSNVGIDQGQPDTQFLPGTVVIFELDARVDPLVLSPTQATPDTRPYIVTTGFNPTHVTPYTTAAGRDLLLVTQTGAIGIQPDDPNTDAIEGGALPITDGAIDVIDTDALELVATIPLVDANPSFGPLAIDPTGRVALFGDVNARRVYGIDLDALAGLPPAGQGGEPVLLDGAVIFDGTNPLEIPARPGGAPTPSCPGQIGGLGFNHAGDRVYVLETCDGTVAAFDADLSGSPSLSELRNRIVFASLSVATAPLRVDTLGQLRQPSSLKVRPGIPGVEYVGPDVFFTIGDPEGFLCGVRIDAL